MVLKAKRYGIVEEIAKPKNISFVERVLNTQLAMKNSLVEKKKDTDTQDETVKKIDNDNVQIGVDTEVIQENNIQSSYTNSYGTVEVKNSSKYQLTEDILTPNIEISNKTDILIFHTHTCESYTPTENFKYDMTGSYRTTDLNYSVSRVGDELERQLTNKRL